MPPVSSDLPEEVRSRVAEFRDEHRRAMVRDGDGHGLGRRVEGRLPLISLAPELCELAEQPGFGFLPVVCQSREEVVRRPAIAALPRRACRVP